MDPKDVVLLTQLSGVKKLIIAISRHRNITNGIANNCYYNRIAIESLLEPQELLQRCLDIYRYITLLLLSAYSVKLSFRCSGIKYKFSTIHTKEVNKFDTDLHNSTLC